MKREATDEVLSHLDKMLAESAVVACWRCLKGPGTPSLCVACKEEVGYERPPANTPRVLWD